MREANLQSVAICIASIKGMWYVLQDMYYKKLQQESNTTEVQSSWLIIYTRKDILGKICM